MEIKKDSRTAPQIGSPELVENANANNKSDRAYSVESGSGEFGDILESLSDAIEAANRQARLLLGPGNWGEEPHGALSHDGFPFLTVESCEVSLEKGNEVHIIYRFHQPEGKRGQLLLKILKETMVSPRNTRSIKVETTILY